MEEATGPVIFVALISFAVLVPTALIPGITGRLYQEFAVTIAVSLAISACNALTLSPALSVLLLPPRGRMCGPLETLYGWLNHYFVRATQGCLSRSRYLIEKAGLSLLLSHHGHGGDGRDVSRNFNCHLSYSHLLLCC